MSKRKSNGQFAPQRSPAMVGLTWLAGFASLVLPYFSGQLLLSDLAAFRSCNKNNNGLQVVTCGKHSINPGDLLFLALFGLSVALVVSLFTASWRMSRRAAA